MIHSEEFKKEAWEGVPAPKELKEVVERITQSYNINGLCDLGYIANIVAYGLGFGDGRSHFKKIKIKEG